MNCITNWIETSSKSESGNFRTSKDARSMALARMNRFLVEDEEEEENFPELRSEPPAVPAMTLLGPPKEYCGNSHEDRYAYLLFEAITLIHRYGFETNISSLQQMRAYPNNGHKKHTRRIPGLLGFLLTDMDANTEVAVFESNGELIAHLGFRTYHQPWLSLHCYPAETDQTMDKLQCILSKKFFLIKVPHTTQRFPFPLVHSPSPREGNICSSTEIAIGSLELQMTTGNVAPMMARSSYQDRLWTKFVIIESGQTVALAFWSYTNDRQDLVGPAMEVFEPVHGGPKNENLSLILSCMEDKIIEIVTPLVAFRLRVWKVQDPRINRWFLKRGYAKTGDGTGFCKAFVVF